MDSIGQPLGDFSSKAALIGPGGRIELGTGEVTMGRAPTNTIVVNDPRASRSHAVVRQHDKGHAIIDVGSANGTLVNDQRLQINISYTLKNGDTIRIGNTSFTYELNFPNIVVNPAPPPPHWGEDADDYPLPQAPMAPPPPFWRDNTGAMAIPPLMAAAPPPPAAAPPPALFRRLVITLIVIALLVGGLYLVVRITGGASSPVAGQKSNTALTSTFSSMLLFISQIVLLTTAICLIPTFVYRLTRRQARVIRVFVESLIYIALFQVFGLWLFGTAALGTWIIYASALIILIEAGSHLVQWRKDSTLKRLVDGSSFKSIKGDADAIEKMARYEVVLYIPVPVGLISGMIIGLIRHQTPLQIVEFCFQLVLSLAALVLFYFLCVGFKRMYDPLFKTIPASLPEFALKKRKGKNTPKFPPRPQKNLDQQYIDLACDVSGLRKVYKFDALHNTIMLVAFLAVVTKVTFVAVDMKWIIASLLLLTLVFSEIPYGIGQYLLHQRILENYTGGKYAEMAKKLQDYAPTFPPWEFLGALLTTGTAGGILYVLFSQFIQNVLSTIIK